MDDTWNVVKAILITLYISSFCVAIISAAIYNEDCPGFETFGADVKAARKAKQLSRSALADMIHCDSRYLANIENEGTLPSLPVVIQLIKICGLPVERYFNPELMREESAERQRVSHKLQLCPEEYLPIVEGAIDGALRIHEQEKEPVCV